MDGTILCEKAPVYFDYCLTMYRVLDDPSYSASEEERDAMQQIRDHAYSEGKTFHPETLTKDDLVATAFAGMTPEAFRAYVVDFADKVNVVGVAVWDKPDDTHKAMGELNITWPVIEGGANWTEPTDLYGVSGIPHILVIAGDTIVDRGLQGEELTHLVEKLVANKQ